MTTDHVPAAGYETVALTGDDLRRARTLLGRMPYGGSANFRLLGHYGGIDGAVHVSDLLDDLDRLADNLAAYAAEHDRERAELDRLNRAVRGFGDLLNLAGVTIAGAEPSPS
jgi:hypothetical protein